MKTLTRDRRPLGGFPSVWVTENVCRFLAGFGRVLTDGVTARIVFMQDCFHAELSSCKIVFMQIVCMQCCFHARLFSCKIVFMQDCFHADCLHARLFPCKIAFMQDFMQHAGGFLCIFAKMGPKSGSGGSQIDPGASPERPKAEKSGQKCTESFPRASRKVFSRKLG